MQAATGNYLIILTAQNGNSVTQHHSNNRKEKARLAQKMKQCHFSIHMLLNKKERVIKGPLRSNITNPINEIFTLVSEPLMSISTRH